MIAVFGAVDVSALANDLPDTAIQTTPDGRYLIVRGRLWRKANPNLPEVDRARLVAELMNARRAVAACRRAGCDEAQAHADVDRAKQALGERGPVWWDDGAPDYNRRMARTTPYAEWYRSERRGACMPLPPS